MAAKKPMPESFTISTRDIFCIFFVNENKIHMLAEVSSNRYHTNNPSFKWINLPNTPVKPARKTEICNWINAFFMQPESYKKKRRNQ